VDKTATFVTRNGPEFEERIRMNEISNPKFNFLASNDPYHAYYQHKLKELKEGRAAQTAATAAGTTAPASTPAALTSQQQDAKDAKDANVQAGLQKLNISSKTQDTQSRLIEQMIILKGISNIILF
jgi:splicing factor 3A subunit 1